MHYNYGYSEDDRLRRLGDMKLWRRIFRYTLPNIRGVAGAVLLSLFISASGLLLPYLVSIGVDRFIVTQDLAVPDRFDGLARLSLPFVGIIILSFAADFLQVVLLEWTGQNIMHRLRQDLFRHLLGLDLAFFNRNPVGRLVTRLTNDVQNMHEMFTSVIVTLFNDFVRIAGILVVLFWMNWRLALLVSLLIPFIIGNTAWFSRLAREAFRRIRTTLAGINSFLQETVAGISVVQLFMREADMERRFVELNQRYYRESMYQIKIFGIFMPLLEVLSSGAIALIIWYGGGEIMRGNMTLGMLVAFLYYMRLFFQPVRELSQKYSIVQSAMASAERIFQLLDTENALPAPAPGQRPDRVTGAIEFKGVHFSYEAGSKVLRDFSLAVAPGETLAVVGSTGAGKTTLINLLGRYYDPEAGSISVDGVDLRQFDLNWLRRNIGLVMQDVYIVPATVRENIVLDEEISAARLQQIIGQAQLEAVIGRLPQGLDTRIGEGGMELSAGQRQLLSLARVLARDPRILVLDEATSSIDSETEMFIERALDVILSQRTSIVIAHRLSTIRRAHRIIVMAGGRIVEQGSHEQLMAHQGYYRHLQDLQVIGGE